MNEGTKRNGVSILDCAGILGRAPQSKVLEDMGTQGTTAYKTRFTWARANPSVGDGIAE